MTAVFTAPLGQCHARQFKKRVKKTTAQHPVVSLNDQVRPTTVIPSITVSDRFAAEADLPVRQYVLPSTAKIRHTSDFTKCPVFYRFKTFFSLSFCRCQTIRDRLVKQGGSGRD